MLIHRRLLILLSLFVVLVLAGCSTASDNQPASGSPSAGSVASPSSSSSAAASPSSQPSAPSESASPSPSGTAGTGEAAASPAPGASASASPSNTATPGKGEVTPQPSKAPEASSKPSAVSPAPSKAPNPSPSNEAKANTVTLSVTGDTDTGTILDTVLVELKKGDTVLDVLKRTTRASKIQMEYRGSGGTAYVEGINNLYEFDQGAKSGWMYRVNGDFPSLSAGAYKLKAGDKLEWVYTLDLGKDVGAKVDP